MSKAKEFFLVDPSSKVIRRESDEIELCIILERQAFHANPAVPPQNADAGAYAHARAMKAIQAIKDASPEVCCLTDVTSVCYCEAPREERPRSA